MAAETTPEKRKRTPAKRLTAEERKAKAVADIATNVARAGELLVRAAEGMVAAGNRAGAKRALGLWEQLIDVVEGADAESPQSPPP